MAHDGNGGGEDVGGSSIFGDDGDAGEFVTALTSAGVDDVALLFVLQGNETAVMATGGDGRIILFEG